MPENRSQCSLPKIDVVMLTWNSNKEYFPKVVQSILKNCNLCHLIVVDRFSEDGTIDTLSRSVPSQQLRVIKSYVDLAKARRLGADHVDTEWFAYVDSDVVLCEGWQEKMFSYTTDQRIAAVQAAFSGRGATNKDCMFVKKVDEVTTYMIIRYGLFNFTKGLTTQTLVRKEAIKNWNPPAQLCAFEDYHLTQQLLREGWLFLRVFDVQSNHYKMCGSELDYHYKQGLWEGANIRLIQATKFLYFLLEVCSRLVGGSLRSIKQRSGRSFLANFMFRLGYLRGYLEPFRFRRWVR